MGLIKDTERYQFDTSVSGKDYLIGTDADDNKMTKSFSVDELVAYISTQVDGASADNLFQEIDLGTLQEGDSISALANALPLYTITDTVLPIYKVTLTPRDSTLTREMLYVTLNKGKGTYGSGGDIILVDGDFYNLNPVQLETERNSIVIESLIGANQILQGNVTYSGSGMIYESTLYKYVIGGELYTAQPDDTITLSNGGANPRIDVIAADTNGDIVVIAGTEATSPVEPALTDYNSQIKLAIVNVSAGATTPTGVVVEKVYDENAGEPTEWTGSENTGGARLILNSTLDPYLNSTAVRGTSLEAGDSLSFQNDSTLDSSDYDHLSFRIRLQSGIANGFGAKISLQNGATGIAGAVPLYNGFYNFDTNDTDNYQLITIPLRDISTTGLIFDKIVFDFDTLTGAELFHIDDIKLVGGIEEISSNIDIPERTSDLVNDGENGLNPFITADDIVNIFNSDGSITGNRTLNTGVYRLTLDGLGNSIVFNPISGLITSNNVRISSSEIRSTSTGLANGYAQISGFGTYTGNSGSISNLGGGLTLRNHANSFDSSLVAPVTQTQNNVIYLPDDEATLAVGVTDGINLVKANSFGIVDISGFTTLGGIGGAITNDQIAFGSSTAGEIEGSDSFKVETNISAFLRLAIGQDDTVAGGLSLYGHSTNSANAQLRIYNNANSDTNVEYWQLDSWDAGVTGNFRLSSIGTVSGAAFMVNDATLALSAPSTSIADIDAEGDKGLLTKEYLDNYAPVDTYANLPTSPSPGDRAFVTDCNTKVFHDVAVSGGVLFVPVFYDGTDWRVG